MIVTEAGKLGKVEKSQPADGRRHSMGGKAGKTLGSKCPLKPPQVAMDQAMGQRYPIPTRTNLRSERYYSLCVTQGGVEPGLHPMTRSMKEEAKRGTLQKSQEIRARGDQENNCCPHPRKRQALRERTPNVPPPHPHPEPALRQQRGELGTSSVEPTHPV